MEEEQQPPRAIPKGHVAPRKKPGVFEHVDPFDAVVYGGGAAAVVAYSIWAVLAPIWRSGSSTERSILLGLLALAVAVISNDIRSRQWSMLSRLLVGAWVAVVVVFALLSLLA